MPGIAHLIFGLFIVIPIMYLAKDKFNYKVAFIFVLNCWNGPDVYWPYRFIPFDMHSLLGFLVLALPLAMYYSYLSRFSIKRSKNFFEIIDDGRREVNWRNAYLLVIAGGISHTFIDSLFHLDQNIHLFEEFHIPIESVLWFGASPINISDALIILGFAIMITASILIIHFLSRDFKDILVFLFATIGFVFLMHYILGGQVFGDELEISAISYMSIFLFIPLSLLAYVANDVNENPITEPASPLMDVNLNLKLIAILALIISSAFVFLGLSGIFAPEILDIILGMGDDINEILLPTGILIYNGFTLGSALFLLLLSGILTPGMLYNLITMSNITNLFPLFGSLITICASIGLIGSIGLFTKKNKFRYFVIFTDLLLLFFVFPFAIVLFLCQNDVKALFK